MRSAPLTTDAQALAKRLERKIENLTKIGGQLQTDNKGTVYKILLVWDMALSELVSSFVETLFCKY